MVRARISMIAAGLAAIALAWTVPAASAAAGDPTIGLSASTARPGDLIVVSLTGWPIGPVTVSVCGNRAARGSQDCDLTGAQGAGVADPTAQTIVQLPVSRPPPPCPCVVMVANAAHDVVKAAPLVILGVPTGPVVSPAPVGPLLDVRARLGNERMPFLDRLKASLGGRVERMLVLEVKNLGTRATPELKASASVGRAVNSGDSIAMPPIGPLAPGQTGHYAIPVTLAAPSHGRYTVSGTLDGYGNRVDFATSTANTPVLFVLLCVGLLGDLAVLLFRRTRRRHVAGRLADTAIPAMPADPPDPIAEELEPEFVGSRAEWPMPPGFGADVSPSGPVDPVLEPVPIGASAHGPGPVAGARSDAQDHFFQSRKAALVTCGTVAALSILVIVAALPPSSSRSNAITDRTRPSQGARSSPEPTGQASPTPATQSPGAPRTTSPGQSAAGSATGSVPGTTLAPGVVPGEIRVIGNSNVRDGQAVTVQITATTGSQIFGFDIRLCAADATVRFDSDMRPTQGGKCILNPLSPGSEASQEIQADPPYSMAQTTFRVGVGTERFTTTTARPVTITCGPGHPCQLALKIQFPDGFAFRSYPVTYA